MLDLPAAAHLFHDELGIHKHVHGGLRCGLTQLLRHFGCQGETVDQTVVFGNVIGGLIDVLPLTGQFVRLPGTDAGGVDHGGSCPGESRVASRTPVGFHPQSHAVSSPSTSLLATE